MTDPCGCESTRAETTIYCCVAHLQHPDRLEPRVSGRQVCMSGLTWLHGSGHQLVVLQMLCVLCIWSAVCPAEGYEKVQFNACGSSPSFGVLHFVLLALLLFSSFPHGFCFIGLLHNNAAIDMMSSQNHFMLHAHCHYLSGRVKDQVPSLIKLIPQALWQRSMAAGRIAITGRIHILEAASTQRFVKSSPVPLNKVMSHVDKILCRPSKMLCQQEKLE